MWTLEQGVDVARSIEPLAIASGFHVAIGGSVLHRGESQKDLDIFVYPHKTSQVSGTDVDAFKESLFKYLNIATWEAKPHKVYGDSKVVESAEYVGKRIDFFFLK